MLKFPFYLTPRGTESCRAVSAESYAAPPGQRTQSSSRGLLFGEPGVRIPSVPEPSLKTKLNPLPPILTAHLFPKLDGMLMELLRSLAPEDWERQTVSPKWKVKDVAAHLLDTALRGVSIGRDGYVAESPGINLPADLAAYINRLNQEGVTVYGRLSPAVLIALMEVATKLLAEYHASRD